MKARKGHARVPQENRIGTRFAGQPKSPAKTPPAWWLDSGFLSRRQEPLRPNEFWLRSTLHLSLVCHSQLISLFSGTEVYSMAPGVQHAPPQAPPKGAFAVTPPTSGGGRHTTPFLIEVFSLAGVSSRLAPSRARRLEGRRPRGQEVSSLGRKTSVT